MKVPRFDQPSSGDRVVSHDPAVGVDANPALDPFASDLDNFADRRRGRLRRIQPFGVGYGLDESERVVGGRIAAAYDLLDSR